jgi:hypothetical protein
MRSFEFITEEKYSGLDTFVTSIKNLTGRYTSKRTPAVLRWEAIAQIAKKTGFEMMSDPANGYETFKSLWDKDPKAKSLLEPIVKNFSGKGVELNIPGTSDAEEPEQDSSNETPQDAVEKMASGAVNQQISQNQQGVQV